MLNLHQPHARHPYRLSAIAYRLSPIGYRYRLSLIAYRLSPIAYRLFRTPAVWLPEGALSAL